MTIAYFDIESTAIPAEGVLYVDTIHCIGVKIDDAPTLMYTSRFLPLPNYGGTLQNGLDAINSCDFCCGHNIIAFDNIVIENLLGSITAKPIDTLLLSKLIYTKDELLELDYTIPDFPPSQYGSFSLDSFGLRMQFPKGKHSDWSRLTSDMANYCTQDVEVTYQLYQNLLSVKNFPSQSVIDLEHEVAYLIAQQVHYGFYYSIEEGRKLMAKLLHEQLNISLRLTKKFKPLFLPNGKEVVPAKPRKVRQYVEDTNYIYF